jgi:MFS family permease
MVTIGSVVLAISTPARRGRMMAVYQGCFLFAVGVGPFPGGMLAERYGLGTPFIANALAALIVGAIAWFLVPETREYASRSSAAPARAPPFLDQLRLMTTKVGFMLVCLTGFVHAIVRTGGLFNVVPLVAAQTWAWERARSAAGCLAASSVCSPPILGHDRRPLGASRSSSPRPC